MLSLSRNRWERACFSTPIVPGSFLEGETTGSNQANRGAVEGFWDLKLKLSGVEQELLFDPQTSGGLLLALPESQSGELVQTLKAAGISAAARVGRVKGFGAPRVPFG